MDSKVKIFQERADSELIVAKALKKLSEDEKAKEIIGVPSNSSFYSGVIEHAYYAIFYSAQAYFAYKGIQITSEQGVHQQVYFKFKQLVEKGVFKKELLEIYEDIQDKAQRLLEILLTEKKKRKEFAYETISQANKLPADNSINNAIIFISHINDFIAKQEKPQSG